MIKSNFKSKIAAGIFLIILLFGFSFIDQIKAQELMEKPQGTVTGEVKGGTRVVISTSGPAEFSSTWLGNPCRLVVEFQSRNILSKIDNEVIVNQGAIKKITSTYFRRGQDKSLKSLTFELAKKIPYKIWQEGNAIILDIQTPLETPVFRADEKEVFAVSETSRVIIERLEAMDSALTKVEETPLLLESPEAEVWEGILEEINSAGKETGSEETETPLSEEPARGKKGITGIIFVFCGLSLILGSGFFFWRRRRPNRNRRLQELVSELQEKDKRLEQEETVRKAIEKASLKKEEGYEQLRTSFESLNKTLLKMKKGLIPEKKEAPSVPEKPQEKRAFPRLPLSKDFNKTIILRVGSQDLPQKIKSLAENISFGGLCFGTKRELKKDEPISLRLFFYGEQAPMMRIRAHIVWKKATGEKNYYGVCFDLLEDTDKSELNRYIDSKIGGS